MANCSILNPLLTLCSHETEWSQFGDWKEFQKSGSARFPHLLNDLNLQNSLELITTLGHLLKSGLYLITDCSALAHAITCLIPVCNCQEVATVSLLRVTQDWVCWDKAAAIGQAGQCFLTQPVEKKMLPIFKGLPSLVYLCIEPVNSVFSRARVKLKKKTLYRLPWTLNKLAAAFFFESTDIFLYVSSVVSEWSDSRYTWYTHQDYYLDQRPKAHCSRHVILYNVCHVNCVGLSIQQLTELGSQALLNNHVRSNDNCATS